MIRTSSHAWHRVSDRFARQDLQSIPQPLSEDLDIWQYMDFTKFVALLETQSLFFARVTHLDDPFESFHLLKHPWIESLECFLGRISRRDNRYGLAVAWLRRSLEGNEKWAMVSCWHAVSHESQLCGNYMQDKANS